MALNTLTDESPPLAQRPASPSAREQALATLTREILNHRMLPGQRLVERDLMEQLGVSRTTVRETIRVLASQGLVTVHPGRGAAVASSSRSDAVDLYEVRGLLEPMVVERFIAQASLSQQDRLTVAVLELGEIADASQDSQQILAARDAFYAALFEGAHSPALQRLVETVQARVRVLCASALSEEGRSKAAAAELREVVNAIRRRDTAQATTLMREHIRMASAATLRTLPPE